jgi:5'-deoxynucleotidase
VTTPSRADGPASEPVDSIVVDPVDPPMWGNDGLLVFLRVAGRLKALHRQGWVDRGIPNPESVADHSYQNALVAWILGACAGLDTARLVKLMLVHDLAEAVVGDVTPYTHLIRDGANPSDVAARWRDLVDPVDAASVKLAKHDRERAAIIDLTSSLPGPLRDEICGLWDDYAERRSPEAGFAAQTDKLEALMQALEYDAQGQPADIDNFLASAQDAVTHPTLLHVLSVLTDDMRRHDSGAQ